MAENTSLEVELSTLSVGNSFTRADTEDENESANKYTVEEIKEDCILASFEGHNVSFPKNTSVIKHVEKN